MSHSLGESVSIEVPEQWRPHCFIRNASPTCCAIIVSMIAGRKLDHPHIRKECFDCPFSDKEYIKKHPEMDDRWIK
jgi:hypothetical protein